MPLRPSLSKYSGDGPVASSAKLRISLTPATTNDETRKERNKNATATKEIAVNYMPNCCASGSPEKKICPKRGTSSQVVLKKRVLVGNVSNAVSYLTYIYLVWAQPQTRRILGINAQKEVLLTTIISLTLRRQTNHL